MDDRQLTQLGNYTVKVNWATPNTTKQVIELGSQINDLWRKAITKLSKKDIEAFPKLIKSINDICFEYVEDVPDSFWSDIDNFPFTQYDKNVGFFLGLTK